MNDKTLRRKVAQLAYDNPELRPHLLRLLKQSAVDESLMQQKGVDLAKALQEINSAWNIPVRQVSLSNVRRTPETFDGQYVISGFDQQQGSKFGLVISFSSDSPGWDITYEWKSYKTPFKMSGRIKSRSLAFPVGELARYLKETYDFESLLT